VNAGPAAKDRGCGCLCMLEDRLVKLP